MLFASDTSPLLLSRHAQGRLFFICRKIEIAKSRMSRAGSLNVMLAFSVQNGLKKVSALSLTHYLREQLLLRRVLASSVVERKTLSLRLAVQVNCASIWPHLNAAIG